MEKFEYGTWKFEDGFIVLPNRKFKINYITEVSYIPPENENSDCALSIFRGNDEIQLLASSQSQEELKLIGNNITTELGMPFHIPYTNGEQSEKYESEVTIQEELTNKKVETEFNNTKSNTLDDYTHTQTKSKQVLKNYNKDEIKMKKTKKFNIIGVIIGLIIIIAGICIIVIPGNYDGTTYVNSYSFGADYYTEQYEATRVAVQNIGATAHNVSELGNMIALYTGCAFIFAGVLVCIEYLKKSICCNIDSAEK